MYIQKRGDKFRYFDRYKVNGITRTVSVTLDRNTPQARKKAERLLAEKMSAPSDSMTYSDLVTAYIKYQKATLKMSTWTRNEKSLLRLDFGRAKVADLTAGRITSVLLAKSSEPGTFNEYLKRVKAMFRWAYRNDYIPSSACVDKIQPLKDDGKKDRTADKYLEPDELKKILKASSTYYRNIFEFLALSGLRIGELIALNDTDVTDSEILVNKTWDSNNAVMNTTKTAAGTRAVHIQPELAACIARLRQESNQNRMISASRAPYFVVSIYGGRLSYTNTESTFKSLCVSVIGRELSLHALRHTHVALMASAGISMDAISRRLGHSGTKITKEIYYHVTQKQKEKDNTAFDAVSILA